MTSHLGHLRSFGSLAITAIWGFMDSCYGSKNSYEKEIRNIEGPFDINECEVFQVVQN